MQEESYEARMREACARIVEKAAERYESSMPYDSFEIGNILDIAKWVASVPDERPTKEEYMGMYEKAVKSALGDALMDAIRGERREAATLRERYRPMPGPVS